jgi:hypothetical protein
MRQWMDEVEMNFTHQSGCPIVAASAAIVGPEGML